MEQNKVYGIIYLIRNKVNGKCYIGQTVRKGGFNRRYPYSGKGIERVYKYHKRLNDKNIRGCNYHLLNSIEKYGFDAFEVDEKFDIAYSKEELNKLEYMYIEVYQCRNKNYGYNNRQGGNNGKMSAESRRKMSEGKKGKYTGENSPFFGKHHTEEAKEKNRQAHLGKNSGADNYNAKKIINLYTNEIFDCEIEAVKKYNLNHNNLIIALKNPKTRKCNGQIWMYYEEYLENKVDIDLISKTPQGTKIICLNDMKVFDTIKEASIYYQCDSSAISKVCKGIWSNTHKLCFMYYNEYLKQLEDNIPITTPKTRVKKVICLEDNKVFNSITECAKYYRIDSNSISRVCSKKGNHAGGYHFMYYEEYLKQQNKDNTEVA